ncbi:MAG: O-antigen ligase family protein [Lachnospira sp.]|nr:O-antigen ligase family protein [Lachnospira sp.]
MDKYVEKLKKLEKYVIIFSLFVYLEPQIFKEDASGLTKVDYVYKLIKIICTVAVFLYYISEVKKTNFMLLVTSLQLIGLVSTIINKGAIFRYVGPSLTILTMVMIVELLLENKQLIETLKVINWYFLTVYIINVVSIILIDFIDNSAFGGVYFLGIDNRFIFTFLPWVVSEGIVALYYGNKLSKRWIIIVCLCEGILLYKFSVAAMFAFMIFIAFYLFRKYITSDISIWMLFGYLLLNIFVVIIRVQNIFAPLLQKLGKDITFAGRTYFWDAILRDWKHFFIIGGGMQSVQADKMYFYNSTAPFYLPFCKVMHAHNYLMTLFYRGGIISITIFIIILYLAMKKLKENSGCLYSGLLLSAMIVFFVTAIFDTTDFALLYFIIALSYYVSKIEIKKE